VETPKSVEHAVADFEAAVQRHMFGVLHIHNLQETLKKKGVDFPMPVTSSKYATLKGPKRF
jgi:uncharacterized protein (DUF302 family)